MWSKGNWHVCFHVVIIMKKTVGDLSHMENCIHVQIRTLETHLHLIIRQLQTKMGNNVQLQPSLQPNARGNIKPFHFFLNYIRLIWLRPLMIQMMWSINFRGRGAYGSEIYQNWLHHHQEEMRWLKLVLTLGCLADKRVDQWGLVDALTLYHPS